MAGTRCSGVPATSASGSQAGEQGLLQREGLNVDKPEVNTEQNAARIKYWPALQI